MRREKSIYNVPDLQKGQCSSWAGAASLLGKGSGGGAGPGGESGQAVNWKQKQLSDEMGQQPERQVGKTGKGKIPDSTFITIRSSNKEEKS